MILSYRQALTHSTALLQSAFQGALHFSEEITNIHKFCIRRLSNDPLDGLYRLVRLLFIYILYSSF